MTDLSTVDEETLKEDLDFFLKYRSFGYEKEIKAIRAELQRRAEKEALEQIS